MEKTLSILRIVTKFAIIVAMNRIRVSRRVEKKLAKGLVLLEASDLTDIDLTDQAVEVLSQDGKFLGTAYLSQQNKGIGWFISKEKVSFESSLFLRLCFVRLRRLESLIIRMT